jgi:hypothetical protein
MCVYVYELHPQGSSGSLVIAIKTKIQYSHGRQAVLCILEALHPGCGAYK